MTQFTLQKFTRMLHADLLLLPTTISADDLKPPELECASPRHVYDTQVAKKGPEELHTT